MESELKLLTGLTEFKADRPWGAALLGEVEDVTVRVHWTDKAYHWHVNSGAETFLVLAGEVEMHLRDADGERVVRLAPGDAIHLEEGDEHMAVPVGEARILVVERRDTE